MRRAETRPAAHHAARAPGPGARVTSSPTPSSLSSSSPTRCSRRDAASAGLRARAANLDPHMVLEAWDDGAKVTYDRAIWSELVSMRFVDQARNAFILGPVGVGKTFMATALGHIACRRRISVHFERARPLAQAAQGGPSRRQLRRRRCESSSAWTCS